MFIVVSQCTPILYTLDINYAYRTFKKILQDVFEDNEEEMKDNGDYYITKVGLDVMNPSTEDFETPNELRDYMEKNGLFNH